MDQDKAVATINGREVRFKERLSLNIAPKLPAMLDKCKEGDLRDQVKVLCLIVESWDFDGDPAKPASYGELDIFTDVMPMATAAGEYLAERLQGQEKN